MLRSCIFAARRRAPASARTHEEWDHDGVSIVAVRLWGYALIVAGVAGVLNSVWPTAGVGLVGGVVVIAWSYWVERT